MPILYIHFSLDLRYFLHQFTLNVLWQLAAIKYIFFKYIFIFNFS